MELTEAEILDIKVKLQAIQTAFVSADEQPICDTFYLTATYNKQNAGSEINGDTCEYILSYGEVAPEQGV
jgi:hypothetical protein